MVAVIALIENNFLNLNNYSNASSETPNIQKPVCRFGHQLHLKVDSQHNRSNLRRPLSVDQLLQTDSDIQRATHRISIFPNRISGVVRYTHDHRTENRVRLRRLETLMREDLCFVNQKKVFASKSKRYLSAHKQVSFDQAATVMVM